MQYMHNFISFVKELRIYKKKELIESFKSFSNKQMFVFVILFIISVTSFILLVSKINNKFIVEVPADGGLITEGIIGMPTLVNPVLALSDADKDLTSIVYSGLMRKGPDGTLIPDLAEYPTISQDGKTYTFTIKDNAKFHNGSDVTADDIIFTIDKIKNPLIKSPRKIEWDGVNVEKKDEKTIVFSLEQPYISFMDNTTIGILPSKLWKDVKDTEFSISPLNTNKAIGSGPYKINSVSKNSDGIPSKYYLKRFKDFTLGKPHIKSLNIISYSNEKDLLKDLTNNNIDQASGISPENTENINKNKYIINTATLSRVFGLFFNSNKNKIFSDKEVVKALNKALDRQSIIKEVLNEYGTSIENPVTKTINTTGENQITKSSIEEANQILEKAGWKMGEDGIRVKGGATTTTQTKKVGKKTVTQKIKTNTPITRLSFSITTGDAPEFKKSVELIKEQLLKVGVEVNIEKVYEIGQLNQLIRSRDYESLFFGQTINHESDLYSFWHSSQREDPGLNIAMYNNSKVDNILESIQKTLKKEDRVKKYIELQNEFNSNIPALLIYSPKYLYITSERLKDISIDTMIIPSDRFTSVYTWHADIDYVWKIFNN